MSDDAPTIAPKPEWKPIWLACKKCGHKWNDWQPSGVPVDTWSAHVMALRCIKCGAGGRALLMRSTPLPPGFT